MSPTLRPRTSPRAIAITSSTSPRCSAWARYSSIAAAWRSSVRRSRSASARRVSMASRASSCACRLTTPAGSQLGEPQPAGATGPPAASLHVSPIGVLRSGRLVQLLAYLVGQLVNALKHKMRRPDNDLIAPAAPDQRPPRLAPAVIVRADAVSHDAAVRADAARGVL